MRQNDGVSAVRRSSWSEPELQVVLGSDEVIDLRAAEPTLRGADLSRPGTRPTARAFDVVGASLLLLVCAPLLVVISLALLVGSPGPVLFRHERIGLAGRKFEVLKFRTMRIDAEEALAELLATDPQARFEWMRSHKLENDPRVHGLGRFLRKSSLDELPQLFNVLAGSMSLVGPRPIVEDEVLRYGSRFDVAFSVKPGLTGQWQVAGRQRVTYSERVEMDADYARSKSVPSDIAICPRTVPAAFPESSGPY